MKRVFMAVLLTAMVAISGLTAEKSEAGSRQIAVKPARLTVWKKELFSWLDGQAAQLAKLNDRIWQLAEVAMEEYQSAAALCSFLAENGFTIQRGVAGMPTAFVAEYGRGEPVIGVLAEFDALPGLSQQAVPQQQPVVSGGAGHGCGHNLFGVGSVAAAAALKQVMVAHRLAGTIRLFGCPAEETIVGKVFMARAGLFSGLSCCLQWHPADENSVSLESSNAMNQFILEFFGRTAHAAGDPWEGRSALDAIELVNVGINFLREHLKPTARVHYVIQSGGAAPNIVPDYARGWYYVRDAERESVEKNYERVLNVIAGAARMTDTSYRVTFLSGVHEMLVNLSTARAVYANLLLVGPPKFSAAEQSFAKQMQKNLGLTEKGLKTELEPLHWPEKSWGGGSTDVAEVSWLTPTTDFAIVCKPDNTPGHHWAVVACGGMSIGHKCLLTAAKVLAASGLDFLLQPDLLRRMRQEWQDRMKGREYKSPLSAEQQPPIKPRQE